MQLADAGGRGRLGSILHHLVRWALVHVLAGGEAHGAHDLSDARDGEVSLHAVQGGLVLLEDDSMASSKTSSMPSTFLFWL